MKRKPKSIAKLVDEAACILQRIVRLKAADDNGYARCVTCGKVEPWQDLQGGHFISRTYTAHKCLEENIHPQCAYCNGFSQTSLIAYTKFMYDTYGVSFVDRLMATKNDITKYTRPEIMCIIEDLKSYEKQVRREKGL